MVEITAFTLMLIVYTVLGIVVSYSFVDDCKIYIRVLSILFWPITLLCVMGIAGWLLGSIYYEIVKMFYEKDSNSLDW